MQVCFSLDNYDRGSGGAALAVRELARFLANLDHEVHVLQPGRVAASYRDGRIHVHTRPLRRLRILHQHDRDTLGWNLTWRGVVDRFLDEQPIDLLITQNRLLYSSVAAANARNIPSIVWAHAYRIFCPTQFFERDPLAQCSGACTHCDQGPFRNAISRNKAAYLQGLHGATLVLANSGYMQQVVRHFTGREAPVVYPTFDLDAWQQEGNPDRRSVLFIKPLERKGFPILLEIARRMPDTPFRVVGKTNTLVRRALKRLPNVETVDWTKDMRSVYADSRLLLGPAIWPEPFGRIYVEAASAGLPAVTSDRGGIPEAVGDGGVLIKDIKDIDQWVSVLRDLEDPAVYEPLAQRAREHARSFAGAGLFAVFANAVEQATGLTLIPRAEPEPAVVDVLLPPTEQLLEQSNAAGG